MAKAQQIQSAAIPVTLRPIQTVNINPTNVNTTPRGSAENHVVSNRRGQMQALRRALEGRRGSQRVYVRSPPSLAPEIIIGITAAAMGKMGGPIVRPPTATARSRVTARTGFT
ncbi:unnamed protein product [Tuber aestivum]|uniref:Uncharacterized protein n=1 Tax=Tuber aestivum TaxID=59557 RepID=A0A292PQM5_9PEZI|nr:unnamed protein product [Tuber aestivum]